MDNEKITSGEITAAIISCVIVGWPVYAVFKNYPSIAVWIGAVIIGIIAAYFLYKIITNLTGFKSIDTLERKICKQLDSEGYKHEKQDGVLYVTRKDNHFHVHLWDTSNNRIKRLYFVYDFGYDGIDKSSPEGWAMLSNRINIDNSHVTFINYEDSFQCRFETAISKPKDFIREFDVAYRMIGEAMGEFQKLNSLVEQQFPNTSENKPSIGFK